MRYYLLTFALSLLVSLSLNAWAVSPKEELSTETQERLRAWHKKWSTSSKPSRSQRATEAVPVERPERLPLTAINPIRSVAPAPERIERRPQNTAQRGWRQQVDNGDWAVVKPDRHRDRNGRPLGGDQVQVPARPVERVIEVPEVRREPDRIAAPRSDNYERRRYRDRDYDRDRGRGCGRRMRGDDDWGYDGPVGRGGFSGAFGYGLPLAAPLIMPFYVYQAYNFGLFYPELMNLYPVFLMLVPAPMLPPPPPPPMAPQPFPDVPPGPMGPQNGMPMMPMN